MANVPEIVPVSDLRKGAADLLGRLRKTRKPVVITQRGRSAAVIVSVESYEEAEREREILLRIARGEREVKSGRGHDLASVMADADALIDR
jgi:prevent-host-death family protein